VNPVEQDPVHVMEYKTKRLLAEKYGVSVGKVYKDLFSANCKFSRKRRKEITKQERENRSRANKGRKLTERQIEAIKKANSCNYNGLNGYGHTKRLNTGYILTYAPHHPNAHKDGYVMFHTVLMERKIGRYLEKNEVVHHINHDRADNRIENLLLMDRFEHSSMHMKERRAKRRNDLSIALL
jgi:flagellar basal body rod protein FlgC